MIIALSKKVQQDSPVFVELFGIYRIVTMMYVDGGLGAC